ncbi:MAG: CehA/McbA family metallohydrolase [Planctomycetes bacterium]|nr:CehA/McbA family metallohydrolase [Planctomycetota bacterium]
MERFDYKGIMHMHSVFSDGKDTVQDIMTNANLADLDFVVLTDHDNMKAKSEGLEGWHQSTLLIVGTEITPPNNHYIAFGEKNINIEEISKLKELPTQQVIDGLREKGWVGFIAHPFNYGSKKLDVDDLSWKNWDVTNFTGVSVWHFVSSWLQEVEKAPALDIRLYDEFERVVCAPSKPALDKWDELLAKRKVTAIAELDNHSSRKKFEDKEIIVFPLNRVVKTLANHVILNSSLSNKPEIAKKQIANAFMQGNVYICNHTVGEPDDFYFTIEDSDSSVSCGDEFRLNDKAELTVSLPTEATIKLIKNGLVLIEEKNFEMLEEINEPGVYRIEVMKDGSYWIITNPIYVRK